MPGGVRFTGGIITEQAKDFMPRARPGGFRTNLPPRVVDSGRIFRDIIGLEGLFETKGSGAGPEMLRTEMGVMYGFDLERSLSTQLCELDAVTVTATPAAANTTDTVAFSFPTMTDGVTTAARHRIIGAALRVAAADLANFQGATLDAQPFGDPVLCTLGWALAADVDDPLGGASQFAALRNFELPLWGRREVDYRLAVRSGAGGGSAATLQLLVELVPDGVEVPI